MSRHISGFSLYLGEGTKQKPFSSIQNKKVADAMLYSYHIREGWLTSVSGLIVYEVGNIDQNDNLGSTLLIKDFSNIIVLCYNAGPSCMFIDIVCTCKIRSYIYVN